MTLNNSVVSILSGVVLLLQLLPQICPRTPTISKSGGSVNLVDKSRIWKDVHGWHKVTRDGRTVGKDCNPCSEPPEESYKAPMIPQKDQKLMCGDCTTGVRAGAKVSKSNNVRGNSTK